MTNTSDSDLSFSIPFTSSNVILPSYNQNPRKKRSKISNNQTVIGASSSSSASKPKPVKKPDPNAPNITRPCTECGKQFWSLKALFGHMRCHPERQWRGINPPPNFIRGTTTAATSSSSSSWVSATSEEDHNVASCLLMLANSSTGGCNKVLGSHQALGGHRATHKHVKECFSITEDPPQEIVGQDKRKSVKLVSGINHPCNICFKVFLSGQALGGHMRCHWERDQEENQDSIAIDLNVPATTMQNSSSDTSSGCSLDLSLGL